MTKCHRSPAGLLPEVALQTIRLAVEAFCSEATITATEPCPSTGKALLKWMREQAHGRGGTPPLFPPGIRCQVLGACVQTHRVWTDQTTILV